MWKTTRWSQILEAQQQNQEALEELCKDYWTPIYKFTCKYCNSTSSEDLVQEFFTKFLENKWIERVSKEKGKFRTFLITTLIRFIKDKHQKRQIKFEKGMKSLSESGDEISHFNRYWVENLLSLVAKRMHAHYADKSANDYIIFSMYYAPSSSVFLRPEDIVQTTKFLQYISQGKTDTDKVIDSEIATFSPSKVDHHILSQILNKFINEFTPPFVDDCSFTEVDIKMQEPFIFDLRKSFANNSLCSKNLVSFLNELLTHHNLGDHFSVPTKVTSTWDCQTMCVQNRFILEYVYPQYLEKYTSRQNRKNLEEQYHSFLIPLLNGQPSYINIANYLQISKYQVEKSLKLTAGIYRELMRDEVSRYVCPYDIAKEIQYLHNLL